MVGFWCDGLFKRALHGGLPIADVPTALREHVRDRMVAVENGKIGIETDTNHALALQAEVPGRVLCKKRGDLLESMARIEKLFEEIRQCLRGSEAHAKKLALVVEVRQAARNH